MPYIITTHPRVNQDVRHSIVNRTRHAVATLDEAREYVHDTILTPCDAPLNAMAPFYPVEDSVPEQGGTVGPLPDGTVIEVKRVLMNELRVGQNTMHMNRDELVALYNSKQEHS